MYYIYTILCEDNSLYTGITTNVQRRIRQHCGRIRGGAKYTKSHPPKSVEMVWQCATKQDASRLEYAIKHHLSRAQKLQLILKEATLENLLPMMDPVPFCRIECLTLKQYLGEE